MYIDSTFLLLHNLLRTYISTKKIMSRWRKLKLMMLRISLTLRAAAQEGLCVAAAGLKTGRGTCRLSYHRGDLGEMQLASEASYTTFIKVSSAGRQGNRSGEN